MKLKTLTLATLCLAPALLALQPRGTAIAFSIAEGSTRTKSFTSTLEMSMDDMAMTMNGQESPAQPDVEMHVTGTTTTTVTDEYVKLRDGAPAVLKRTYDAIGQTQAMEMEIDVMGTVQNNDTSVGASSELEGTTVIFRWSEDAEDYVAAFPEDDGGEEELLEGLREDMDLRSLLPSGEVAEGDEWELPPTALRDVLGAGGDLKLVPEESDESNEFGDMSPEMGSQDQWFTEDMEGEVKATFQGTRTTEEGVKVAVIVYAIEISNAVDMTDAAREGLEAQEMPPGVEDMQINSSDVEVTIEGEATLLWNIEDGYVHSFELSSEFGLVMDVDMEMSAQGMKFAIEQSMEFSGSMTLEVSVE